MFTIKIVGTDLLQKHIDELKTELPQAICEAVIESLWLVGNVAVTKFMLQGQPYGAFKGQYQNIINAKRLTNRSYRLARSLVGKGQAGNAMNAEGRAVIESQNMDITIGSLSTAVPYAKIHEEGGVTSPHIIRSKSGKMLRWYDKSGNPVFARVVNHPGSNIPARPYLNPALNDPDTSKGINLVFNNRMKRMLVKHKLIAA